MKSTGDGRVWAAGPCLRNPNDEGGAAREPGDDGARQEVCQEAQPQGAHRDVHEAHHQRDLPVCHTQISSVARFLATSSHNAGGIDLLSR